jgi:predicted enzyme related to lactoylglutathione lyase
MKNIQKHMPGSFCWVELGTSDPAGAKKFYQSLFGWGSQDRPMGPDFIYTILQSEGQDAAALYKLMPDQVSQGVPPHWLSYVAVDSADDAARKAKSLGGTVIVEPMDVPQTGRFAVIQDPQRATFGVWQSGQQTGVKIRDEVNSLVWNELATTDEEGAGKFYTSLFNWQTEVMPTSQMEYTIFKNDGKGIAGMYKIRPDMKGMPPNWVPYFNVSDADDIANKTQSGGGKVMAPPMDVSDVGRIAIFQDPQGAMFAIIKPSPQM